MSEIQINKIGKKIHKDREEIINFCSKFKKIHLYGMGYVADMMYRYLQEEDIEIADVIVGKGHRNIDKFKHLYDVLEVSEASIDENDGIILCVRSELQEEIKKSLYEIGIKDFQIYEQSVYLSNSPSRYMSDSYIKDTYLSMTNGFFKEYFELDDLGERLGTDKCGKKHNYLNKYEFFLNKFKQEKFNLLELGVFKGGSLEMWGRYFEKAQIFGVDIDENCKQYEYDNCKVIIGDLGDEELLNKLGDLEPSVIIDDASHFWSHQIKAIYQLLPKLKSGGIYIMEDIGTSFSSYRFMNYDDSLVTAYDFCSSLAEVVSSGEFLRISKMQPEMVCIKKEIEELAKQIEMISFIHESCIIVKK